MAEILEFVQRHPLLVGGLFAILALIIWTEYQRFSQSFSNITPPQLVNEINRGEPVIVDVRESKEVTGGIIEGAKHIPMTDLSKRITELDKFKERRVIVYCRSGNRSASACRTLEKQGFTDLAHLQGGILAWESASLPLKKR